MSDCQSPFPGAPFSEGLLVVDDDPVQARIIGSVASQAGYCVSYASTLQAAVEAISAQSFATVTVDLMLGEHDGIELLRYISRFAIVPRVVIVSGCEERIVSSTVKMAQALGIKDALGISKPLNLEALRGAMTACSDATPAVLAPATMSGIGPFQHALQEREFYPVFQPKIQISTGKVVGCEALARWISPDFGQVAPDVFIPALERSNDMMALTMMLLEDSIIATREPRLRNPDFTMAVNLSATLLADNSLPDEIEKVLLKHELAPQSLMLEVTESVAMSDFSRAMDILLRFRIKGFGISMDDFGTGYSSLATLARLPFNELKIDKSLVIDCVSDPDLWKIVRGTVAMGHEFKMKVVAEGIEDLPTLRALAGIGCDLGQGYYFSRPLPAAEFTSWYDRWLLTSQTGAIRFGAPAMNGELFPL